MKTSKRSLAAHLLGAALGWFLIMFFFPAEFLDLTGAINTTLGPMGFFLLAIAAYLLVMGVTFIRYHRSYTAHQKEFLPTHMEDFGDVAAVMGLLGTVWAMIGSSGSGVPDMGKFLESLNSTFAGSGLYVLTIAFRAIMTRPGVAPGLITEYRGGQEHDAAK